ncbi:hypothetical protein FRC04_005767 [Tulasnella sp. 424]|nr:hypothetical protein FRC04_005767 [Tulasnella sp. 424]KAG8977552.1 hypothetical protein FRC05_001410 [Tulasnella sp. 425]
MASAAVFLNATQDIQHQFANDSSFGSSAHHHAGSNSTASDIFSLTDDELKERLHFIREIGYGNWGSVWSCFTKDSPTREKVAVKLVHRSKTPTTAARVKSLWNEMKIHRSFRQDSHPSIVSFHSFTITPSFALITMEYLPRLIPVEVHESKARGWFESLLGGVHFLHRHKVSHNDIKPANILLSATCIPVLVDFGFAEHYSSSKTPKEKMFLSNLAYGTPEYLSPERAKGLIHDTRLSDMWSLGVTFFEILVGRTPFELVEGEAFETQEDLERYWKRTKEGTWLGQEEWQRRMSDGLQSLLRRMMCPDVKRRIKAGEALADPYWVSEPYPFGDDSYLASPPGIFTTPRPSAIPTFESELKAVETTPARGGGGVVDEKQQQQLFATPTKQPPRSPAAKKGKNRKEKPAKAVYQEPTTPKTPARTAASTRRAAVRSSPPSHPSFSAAARAPAALPQQQQPGSTAASRAAASGIPVTAKRKPLATTVINGTNTSNKENAPSSARGKKKAMPEDDSAPVNVHIGKKVPARKPIPAGLASLPRSSVEPKTPVKSQPRGVRTEARDDAPPVPRGSAARVPSTYNQPTAASDAKKAPLSVGAGSTALAMARKYREEKEKLKSAAEELDDPSLMMSLDLNRSLVQSLICPSPEAKRVDGKSAADADRSGASSSLLAVESPAGPSVPRRDPPKSVLELVKEAKASMNERARLRQQQQFQLQEESMIEEPGSVNDFDISGSYFGMESQLALPSPSVADLSLVGAGDLPRPLFQSDTFPRSSKDSTSASIIFKQSLRMSMDKLGSRMSSAVGASKHSRAVSVQEIRSSFDTARENAMTPTLDANERRSADSEADRMTLWLRSIERVVEETRTNFQSGNAQVPVSPTRLPSLPPRIIQVSPSKRSSNKVHPVLMVDSPSGRKRRATVGGSSAPEFVMAQEGRLSSTVDDIASLNRSVSMRVQGHISPVANLEQEILRAQSPAPQRLSAVIDPADFSVEFMRSKDRTTSPEPKAPTPLLPAVTISQRAPNYSPPPSPTTSLSDQRRKSRTSILLMDRLGVPSTMNLAASTSSVNFGTSTEGTPPQRSTQSSPKDYDRLLMSTSGVSRLGKGYQSDRCGKRKSVYEPKAPSPPQPRQVPSTPQSCTVPSTPSSKFNRKTLFGTRTMGTNKSAEPVMNRSNSSTFKVATGKLVKSFDDLGGKKATPTLAGARLKVPQNTPSPKTTTEKTDSVTGRVRKALQNILSTPRRPRTFTTQQGL